MPVAIVKDGKPAVTLHVNAPISDQTIPIVERVANRMTEEELAMRVLHTAVEEFNYHIQKMSGTALEVKIRSAANGPVMSWDITAANSMTSTLSKPQLSVPPGMLRG